MIAKRKTAEDLRHEIEVRAYLIWEREGRPHGRHDEHWRQAQAEMAVPAKKKAAPKKVKAEAKAPEVKAKASRKTKKKTG